MKLSRRGTLFVISGPSGVGKGTIKDAVLSRIDNMQLSISATTRKPRKGEINGKDYFFIDTQKFQELINEEQFLEWANVYKNLYGTPRQFVEDNLNQGRDVMLEIDIQGALQVKEKKPDGVFIFIAPPSLEELSQRLVGRGKDTPESITLRLAACKQEMDQARHYDYMVINRDLSTAVDMVCSIITAERCKIKNYSEERDMIDSSLNQGHNESCR